MRAKEIVIAFIVANCFLSCFSAAALRRTPKVYNALITTDENLTSSRAYPVIQPTIHETGISHFPFTPYNSFGYYGPGPLVRFGQPFAPGLVQQEQVPYPLPQEQFPPQMLAHLPPHMQGLRPFNGYPIPQNTPPTAPSREEIAVEAESAQRDPAVAAPTDQQQQQQPVVPPRDAPPPPQQTFDPQYMPIVDQTLQSTGLRELPKEKLPILLNEYGLPPSLVPLPPQYPINRNANAQPPSSYYYNNNKNVNLPPYAFNQYPIIPGFYDPITGLRQQFLPPYDYPAVPQQTYALAAKQHTSTPAPTARPVSDPVEPAANQNPQADHTETTGGPAAETEDSVAPDFDSIKNASKNKNSEVPDVPPPPIPSGAKTKASA